MRVEYHPAIEKELREIVEYYESRSFGLGNEFLNEFERQVLKIASNPSMWKTVENNIRRVLMNRFPYAIYFHDLGNGTVRVTVVKHQRRHPQYGRDRT